MNEHKKISFNTDIGQKAKVERHDIHSELAERSNKKLRDIGSDLNPYPETLEYMGSMAVHIYLSPLLGHVMFIGQANTLGKTEEHVASTALNNLRGDAQEFYGRQRQTKRSGF